MRKSIQRTASILEEEKENIHETTASWLNIDAGADTSHETILTSTLGDFQKTLTEEASIERLYTDVISQTLHRCSGSREISHDTLLEYARNAFKISKERHEKILQIATTTISPKFRLYVDIIQAENLKPKDSNGLSDPFVTIYFKSNAAEKSNSTVKFKTLNPTWNERCSLLVPNNFSSEQLIIEVWDFDEIKTVGDQLKKISEVKNIKYLGRFLKEFQSSERQELIGSIEIPLADIPASGKTDWYPLKKNPLSSKYRGSLLIKISFGSLMQTKETDIPDHQILLKIILAHELQELKLKAYEWKGKFGSRASAIITQHLIQSGLTKRDSKFCQWLAFTCLHKFHPLSFNLFSVLLDEVNLNGYEGESEQVKVFWEASKGFLPSCFYLVQEIQYHKSLDELESVCNILHTIDTLNRHKDKDLFPQSSYEWLKELGASIPKDDIKFVLISAIRFGAKSWIETMKLYLKKHDYNPIQQLTKLIQLMKGELQLDCRKQQHKTFYKTLKVNFCHILCEYYQQNIEEACKQIINDTCKQLVPPVFGEDLTNFVEEDLAEYYSKCTHLFELYLSLKSFSSFWAQVSPESEATSAYRDWFEPAQRHWLDMSEIKTLSGIQKAIELDNFKPLEGANTRYSSSVLDALSILSLVKTFWEQLDLEHTEESFACLARLVYGVCRSWISYATRVGVRISEFNELEDRFGNFKISSELCLSICSISQLQKQLPRLVSELGVKTALENMEESLSKDDLERCVKTIDSMVENAQETMQKRIGCSIEAIANKITHVLRKFLNENANKLESNCNAAEEMYSYLERTFTVMHAELPEAIFQNIIEAIWHKFSLLLRFFIEESVAKSRPPLFFSHLHQVLQTMEASFRSENMSLTNETADLLAENKRLLALHSLDTNVLIHLYYEELYDEQKAKKAPSSYGQLTVTASFTSENVLLVNILNANSLMPMDSNNLCDSFVTMQYIPSHRFIEIPHFKTKIQRKTLTPLYDEEFEVRLTSYQAQQGDSMLMFILYDSDLFGMTNEYIAECYLSYRDIRESRGQQIRMDLLRPNYTSDSELLNALKARKTADEAASIFIKKVKSKRNKK